MALLIFTSSISFTLDMHYCQDKLVSISLFGKAKSCYEKNQSSVCLDTDDNKSLDSKAFKHSCCHNESILFDQLIADTNPPIATFQKDVNQINAFPFQIYKQTLKRNHYNNTSYLLYKPPLPSKDFTILHQVFMI